MVDRRTVDDGSFLADGLAGSAPSIVYGTGRVCIEPSCSVRLSRYNSTEWCALHESPASTQRPYDTSTRQPRGRRRNSRARRAATAQAPVQVGIGQVEPQDGGLTGPTSAAWALWARRADPDPVPPRLPSVARRPLGTLRDDRVRRRGVDMTDHPATARPPVEVA